MTNEAYLSTLSTTSNPKKVATKALQQRKPSLNASKIHPVDTPIHIKNDGFATTDESQYKVLREALANMVMHCDHFDSLRSCIRVYTEHIEFMNGGFFPLSVKDILGKIYSKLRNPTIAKLFRFVGIAENAGYGMNKLASWETLTVTRPTIESDRTIATVFFPSNQLYSERQNTAVSVKMSVKMWVKCG